MKNSDYKTIGTKTINGKRLTIKEHKMVSYFKIGKCEIPAKSLDEAVRKFTECQAKREVGNG